MSPRTATLGTHMKRRRLALDIRLNAAYEAAGVAKSTWLNWEKDRNLPEEFNHQRIERVLRWAPGSVQAVLDGGEPVEIDPSVIALPAREDRLPPDDDFVTELRGMNLSPEHRDVLIRTYWADRAREEKQIQEKYRGIARAAEG